MVFNNSILLGAAGQADAGFDTTLIGNSVWFDSGDYFSQDTAAANSSRKEAIFSTWIQRTAFGAQGIMMAVNGSSSTDYLILDFQSDDTLRLLAYDVTILVTSQVFRDVGWYHILVTIDTSQNSNASQKIFVNGEEITSFSTRNNFGSSADIAWGRNATHLVNSSPTSLGQNQMIGYMAQTALITDKSFQQSDYSISDFLDTFTFGTNGSQFIPKKNSDIATIVGAGGNNSFFLNYETSSDLGNDGSSKNNDFTATNMGTANQSGNTPSNLYPVINIIDHSNNTLPTTSEGNLRSAGPGASRACMRTTIPIPTTGKWYWEAKWNSVASARIGFAESNSRLLSNCGESALSWGIQNDGKLVNNNSEGSALFSWSTNDIIAMAYDADNSKFWFGRIASGTTSVTWASSGNPETGANATVTSVPTQITPALDTNTGDVSLFFPEEDWTLSSKLSGFKEINSANLTTPENQGIDYFNAVKYTGNGTAIGSGGKAVTGAGFKPDWVWIKNRDAADDHALYDIARGVTKQWESNTNTTASTESEGLTTFGSDGFTVGNLDQVNTNTEDFISWNWLASNSTSTTSPAGTIASTSSVASPGHFSVGTYTGDGDDNETIGHGLGGIPEMIIVRNLSRTTYGLVWHTDGGGATYTADFAVTATFSANSQKFGGSDESNPTANVFKIGTHDEINADGESFVFYTFRSIAGVCKVGSYIGDGGATAPPYVHLGFRPRFVMYKNASVSRDWVITDTARTTTNPAELFLFPNLAIAEAARGTSSGSDYDIDLLADGFRPITGDSALNGTGNTILYMAMADIGGNGTLPPIYGR